MIRQALMRLRGARGLEWLALVALLAAAVLIMGGREAEPSASTTALEQRMENVLSCVSGAGQVRVLVNEGTASLSGQAGGVTGAVVVAEGAGDLRVRLELQEAVQALLGIEAQQIEILGMEDSQ